MFNDNLDKGSVKIPKYVWIVLVLLILASVVIVTRSFLKKPIEVKKQEVEISGVKTNEQIAKKILNWLDEQRDIRDAYKFSINCNRSDVNNCTSEGSNRSGFGVIWGRFKYFFNHKNDTKELDILKNDLALYADRSKLVKLQNNHWNCKLMYDLWKSDVLGEEEKKNAEKVCFDSEYRIGETFAERKNQISGGSLLLSAIENDVKEKVLTINEAKNYNKPLVYKELGNLNNDNLFYKHVYPYYLSDFVVRYKWKQNNDDLISAYLIFDAILEQYLQNPEQITTEDKCTFALGVIDFFNLYNNNHSGQYKKLTQVLFDSVDWKNIDTKETRTITSCLKLDDELLEERKTLRYSQIKENLLEKLINNNLDYDGFGGNIGNFGGFYGDGGNKKFGLFAKDIRDNGLIVGFL